MDISECQAKAYLNHNAAVAILGEAMVVLCRILSLTVIDTNFFQRKAHRQLWNTEIIR